MSLAGQTNAMQLPASLLSSALLNAASLSGSQLSNSASGKKVKQLPCFNVFKLVMSGFGFTGLLGGNSNISGSQLKNGQSSPGNHSIDDSSHKREVRLMKNRYGTLHSH